MSKQAISSVGGAAYLPPPLPSALQYFTTSMGVSRNRVKLHVDSRVTAAPGDVLEFTMPPQMVDLRSLTLQLAVTTAPAAGKYCVMNPLVSSIIDGVGVSSSGFTIDAGLTQNWNRATHLFDDYTQNKALDAGADSLENVTPAAPVADAKHTASPFQLKDFPGTFIGTCEPRVLDFALFPLKVSFRLAPANHAFITDAVASLSTVKYENACLTFDVIQLTDSGVYESAIQKRLDSNGSLQIPFTRWQLFSSGARPITDSLNFTVSTTSLKGLLGYFVPASVNTNPEAKDATWTNKSNWMVNGIGATNTLANSYFTVGNVNFPQFVAEPHEMFDQTIRNMPRGRKSVAEKIGDTKRLYLTYGGAAHYVRFGLPDDEDTKALRLRDGINCYGQAVTVTWNTSGTTGGDNPTKFVLVESQPVLVVGAGRQLEIIM